MNDKNSNAGQSSDLMENLPVVKNGLRNEMHERLNALAGDWRVAQEIFYLGKKLNESVRGDYTCRRQWLENLDRRFLQDITKDESGKTNYYRLGIFGYSVIDERYEWNTIDAMNANMMFYKGEKSSGSLTGEISMTGEFTDQGILGEKYIGKTIGSRTVVRIESDNRHIVDLYFTPPDEAEVLVTRGIYTR